MNMPKLTKNIIPGIFLSLAQLPILKNKFNEQFSFSSVSYTLHRSTIKIDLIIYKSIHGIYISNRNLE